MSKLYDADAIRQRSEELLRWRSETDQRERELRHARRERRREEQRQQAATEQAAVEHANSEGARTEEINQLVAAAIAVEHAHIIALLTEMMTEIMGMIEDKAKDIKVDLLGKLVDTVGSLRAAAGLVEPPTPNETEKPFQFARERDPGPDEVLDLPNPLAARRELN
jgi:hypothetical protein